MALKGTLKDFGIADILQLIGQQGKTGTLHLKASHQEVHIHFREGAIIRAESSTRNKKDLIGTMLVRAELITEGQLQQALETQKRTLQRLGDVLVDMRAISAEKFKQLVQLQTTETLFKLFTWKTGSYGFEQTDVEADPSFVPLRAESVLMEGFRMVDEWPVVKKKITSYEMTFERLKELPPAPPQANEFDAALDDAFEEKKEVSKGEFQSVGEQERKVYGFATPGRTVRQLIDLSCLGEFDTCKALCNLVNLEYLRGVPGTGKGMELDRDDTFLERAFAVLGRVVVALLMAGAVGFLAVKADLGGLKLGSASASTYSDPAAQRFISRQQMTRIESALALYRLEKGELPEKLEALVDVGLLSLDDLRYPWRDGYFYRRNEAGSFVLLPPLR
ncbi:MAG: DUF4388 domain-containing protein [Myxococcaceae bacterium]|nr:DUF4388 domain-containing protein [Myxococcaceae bacterium]